MLVHIEKVAYLVSGKNDCDFLRYQSCGYHDSILAVINCFSLVYSGTALILNLRYSQFFDHPCARMQEENAGAAKHGEPAHSAQGEMSEHGGTKSPNPGPQDAVAWSGRLVRAKEACGPRHGEPSLSKAAGADKCFAVLF